MWDLPSVSEFTTLPSASSPMLMLMPSFSRAPSAFVRFCRSLPATQGPDAGKVAKNAGLRTQALPTLQGHDGVILEEGSTQELCCVSLSLLVF